MNRLSRICIGTLALLVLTFTACGNGNHRTYVVNGSVEFDDGSHPKFGHIEFYSKQFEINARGTIKRDGSFTLTTYSKNDGAVIGSHEIVIMQQVGNYLLANSGSKIKHDHGSLIDSKYMDYRTSPLTCEIEAGENDIKLILKKLPSQTKDGLPHH